MPEKLARSVVVTPCCRHHSLTERPLLRHSWICAAHSCSSARCFNSALVILTPHNTTVAKPLATFRYYCLMCVYARLGLTVTLLRRARLHTKTQKETQFAERHSSSLCFSGTARAPAAKLLLIVLSIIPPKTVKVSAESFFFPIFFFQTNGRTCPTTVAVPP